MINHSTTTQTEYQYNSKAVVSGDSNSQFFLRTPYDGTCAEPMREFGKQIWRDSRCRPNLFMRVLYLLQVIKGSKWLVLAAKRNQNA